MELDVRIIAADLVAPYRLQGKSGKNDANDATAICEAAARPTMDFVPVKSIEQQSMLCIRRLREGFKASSPGTSMPASSQPNCCATARSMPSLSRPMRPERDQRRRRHLAIAV